MRPRRYLMCEPAFFDVRYSINPWMEPDRPTSTERALLQWKRLHDLLIGLGHTVELLEPVAGLPDMVFAANGAIVTGERVLVTRFRHAERANEAASYLEWFRERGWSTVTQARHVNEGEGDFLWTGREYLAGTGFRTTGAAHAEAARFLGRPVRGLTLVDPRFYHLDTALAVLDDGLIAYYPGAFSPESALELAEYYPDAILADEADAVAFGLNAVCDGKHVILSEAATGLAVRLRERGFTTIGVEIGELLKAGGGVKCCVLELPAG